MLKPAGGFNACGHLVPTICPNARGNGGGPLGASSVTEVDAISVLGFAKFILGNMRSRTPQKYKNTLNHRQAIKAFGGTAQEGRKTTHKE